MSLVTPRPRRSGGVVRCRTGALLLAGLAAAPLVLLMGPLPASAAKPEPGSTSTSTTTTTTTYTAGWTFERLKNPARTLVRDERGALLATLTDGSRSVVLTGPVRTFTESTTAAVTTSTSWVRLLPQPATSTIDVGWLTTALADRSPDVLAVAMQYVTGAPTLRAADGTLLAGDASYGPLVAGVRQEGSDWNDYLQVAAVYDGVTDVPERGQAGSLDCSGYVRMVFGRRLGHPMALTPDGLRLPRRATQMHTDGPGKLIADSTTRLTDLTPLLAGDLVLFDASTDDGTAVDHVGIYLGNDSTGAPRFVSSRKTIDGPTLGDTGGRSILSGSGLYASSLRAVRRL